MAVDRDRSGHVATDFLGAPPGDLVDGQGFLFASTEIVPGQLQAEHRAAPWHLPGQSLIRDRPAGGEGYADERECLFFRGYGAGEFVEQAFLFRSSPRDSFGELPNGRVLEQLRHPDAADPGDNAEGLEGFPTQVEEVVVDADVRDTENVGPYFGDTHLMLVAWRHEIRFCADRRQVGSGQCALIELSTGQ